MGFSKPCEPECRWKQVLKMNGGNSGQVVDVAGCHTVIFKSTNENVNLQMKNYHRCLEFNSGESFKTVLFIFLCNPVPFKSCQLCGPAVVASPQLLTSKMLVKRWQLLAVLNPSASTAISGLTRSVLPLTNVLWLLCERRAGCICDRDGGVHVFATSLLVRPRLLLLLVVGGWRERGEGQFKGVKSISGL